MRYNTYHYYIGIISVRIIRMIIPNYKISSDIIKLLVVYTYQHNSSIIISKIIIILIISKIIIILIISKIIIILIISYYKIVLNIIKLLVVYTYQHNSSIIILNYKIVLNIIKLLVVYIRRPTARMVPFPDVKGSRTLYDLA